MKRLHYRFRPKSNQHADDDDPDFAGELAPAVQRLGKMEVHAVSPRAREANRRAYVGNGRSEPMTNGWKLTLA